MGKAAAPEPPLAAQLFRHAVARAEQAGEPGAPVMFGEVDDQVVVPLAQGGQ